MTRGSLTSLQSVRNTILRFLRWSTRLSIEGGETLTTCFFLLCNPEQLKKGVLDRKRDFMKSFSEEPFGFLHELTCSLAVDLNTIKSEGSGRYSMFRPDELKRAQVQGLSLNPMPAGVQSLILSFHPQVWQQPWTEEAVLHYLSSNGYDVDLDMEDVLLEDDAISFAANAAMAAYGGSVAGSQAFAGSCLIPSPSS